MSAPTRERGGSPSVEAALLAIVFGLLLAFAIAGGRLVAAEAAADHAARSAARVASLQRGPAEAESEARRAAETGLDEQGVRCVELQVSVDVGGFAAPLGTPASVTSMVRCAVEWSDLGLPGAGVRVVESGATSPIDQWRERT